METAEIQGQNKHRDSINIEKEVTQRHKKHRDTKNKETEEKETAQA